MSPDPYCRPAYPGPFGRGATRTDQPATNWDNIADRVTASWELIAPPKLKERR